MTLRKDNCDCEECRVPSIEEDHRSIRFMIIMILSIILGTLVLDIF
jgi:hypothetical protein